MKLRLVVAYRMPTFVRLAISLAVPTFAQQKETTPTQSTPEVTPTPTLGERDTQVLPDGRVTFRLLAPKASDVKVLIGAKSGVYEPICAMSFSRSKEDFSFSLLGNNM